jgi:hypothetical protein
VIQVTKHTRDVLLQVAKEKKIFIEGNFLKIIKSADGDVEFEEYLRVCRDKDSSSRRKRLEITKQVQNQNKELVKKQDENLELMSELESALKEAKKSELEAQKLRKEAEVGKEKAIEDLELIQKKTQFELIGRIVKIALWVIVGVGLTTSALYVFVLSMGYDAKIIESTWSNLFGILLTNSFSIIGTIMGVKYATENGNDRK